MKKINGTGTIYYNKSKKLWTAEYLINENGKNKKKSLYGKTRDIVSQKLTKVMYEYHNDNYIQENGIPLIKLLEQVREDKYSANLISESHYSRMEFVLREIKNNPIGNQMIDKITSRDLQDYFNSLIERYTDSTIKKVWECVKQGFQTAVKQKYIKDNPFENVIKPKSRKETKEVESLTTDEHQTLSKYLLKSNLSEEKYKNVILLELYTGMRIGEILALTKEDIDLNEKMISVKKTISVDKNGELTVKKGTKTYSGKRDIPFPSFLVPHLEEQLKLYENNINKLLFTFEGRIIKASTINTVLKRICKQLELPSTISNHTLRHTFGTRCIESGMTPIVVQKLMGHKDIRVTLNTYTSVLNQFKIEELNKVAQYYLEKDFLVLPDETIKIAKNDYTVEKETVDYRQNAYIPNTEKIEKEITKEEILNFYKELTKFANKKYVDEKEND